MKSVYETMLHRRSVRKYTDKEVKKEDLKQLVKAAMSAPSACNNQPWEFVIVTDKLVLTNLKEQLKFGNYNATSAIIVCGNLKLAKGGMERYWVQDCSAAMQNILLAATELGLGSVWIGVHPLPSVIKPVSSVLSIPDYVVPLGIAYIGFPAGQPIPRTQYNETRVYWENYDSTRKHRSRPKNSKRM